MGEEKIKIWKDREKDIYRGPLNRTKHNILYCLFVCAWKLKESAGFYTTTNDKRFENERGETGEMEKERQRQRDKYA